MNIAIIGTRGIPNYYGGFEQFAEYLAAGLVKRGHTLTVYNSTSHPYKDATWKGVKIVHCNDPEERLGTAGQFLYDLNCIRHTRSQSYDIILQLGYTSSSVWGWMLPKQSVITTNMDGLEWKRTKYNRWVRRFLKQAEAWGIATSDHLIADSLGIQAYLSENYGVNSLYIPYGAHAFENPDSQSIEALGVAAYDYDMLIARLEPENNIEMILDGVRASITKRTFLVIGKHTTTYGEYLKDKYQNCPYICFVGGVYDQELLNNLRYYSNLYFHGHSVGGTNPSLLEAMASNALVCAHANAFNRAILEYMGHYFDSSSDVTALVNTVLKPDYNQWLTNNLSKIKETYTWPKIIDQYEKHFYTIFNSTC